MRLGVLSGQLTTDQADNLGMRYVKLAVGVLLVIGGVIGTFGGASGVFFYFTTCFGAPAGSFDAIYCRNVPVVSVTTAWLIVGLVLDVAAFVTLRFRNRRWTPMRSA
jgi:hypothetical protein